MASSNRREGSNGIDFGADFSELRERPLLKGVDLDLPTHIEGAARVEELSGGNSIDGEAIARETVGGVTDPPGRQRLPRTEHLIVLSRGECML